ncbi:hypothetical protein Rhal01_02855 [Rubritalea halochordaticola]|uniref:Rhamnogalacturonase A/B/Epimerase-like pectate lyase domain-containing protein n=1 Tax=Rubritalea halochordaticola TaxID=714537 RepID=A0ABP9V3V4_9BACT
MLQKFNLIGVVALSILCVLPQSAEADVGLWERKYGVENLLEDADSDNDGVSDGEEKKAGTDPYSHTSVLRLTREELSDSDSYIVWPTSHGVNYQVEASQSLKNSEWQSFGEVIRGNGGMAYLKMAESSQIGSFYRVKIQNPIPEGWDESFLEEAPDSDRDGIADIKEYLAKTDPVTNSSGLLMPKVIFSPVTKLSWASIEGKSYQLNKRLPGGEWITYGIKRKGSGEIISIVVEQELDAEYSITVEDFDSDGDGLTDWEEYQTGFNPYLATSDPKLGEDATRLQQKLNVNVETVRVEVLDPVANVTNMSSAKIRIRRVGGGLDKISFDYTVGGDAIPDMDYESLSGSAIIPFGADFVDVEVNPLATSQLVLLRKVYVSVQANGFYFDGSAVVKVHILRENSINVKDHGAVGDGDADDTQAIQAAITALENDPSKNTLYFPAGTYRLATRRFGDETYYGRDKLLKLGETDLANRDLVIRGEPGTVLYSDVGTKRAHILVVMSSFRTLAVYGMSFEKSKTPLEAGPADGSDGVSLVRVDNRVVYEIRFEDCIFNNCHGAVTTYGRGTEARGNCKNLIFQKCQVLNPYGTNTTGIGSHWGGGQQVVIWGWVERAVYEHCIFEGGGEDMSDHYYCPAGRQKDGCHFGNPLRLEFHHNIVRRMGVEAVFQTNKSTFMANSLEAFEMPPADGLTEVSVLVEKGAGADSTYQIGQLINIRRPHDGITEGANNVFRITDYDENTNVLSFVNEGYEGNDPAGQYVAKGRPIYLQIDSGNYADIQYNYVDGTLPVGAEYSYACGIVLATKGIVSNNVVTGYINGIVSYKEACIPVYPGIDGILIYKNFIETRQPSSSNNYFMYGISTNSSYSLIADNTIVSPRSVRTVGIALRGDETTVRGNIIQAVEKVVNGYGSSQRSTGIQLANQSSLSRVLLNTTRNFDVGVGPQPNQLTPYYVSDHYSIDDELDVDSHGLIEE